MTLFLTRPLPLLLPSCGLAVLAACVQPTPEPSAPTAPEVSIGPIDPRTDDDLGAVIQSESTDADGDNVAYTYEWLQNGLPRTDLTTATVPASETTKGDIWQVKVTPSDGDLAGEKGESTATVLNTVPTVTLVLTPEAPVTGDNVVAVPTAVDADGDVVAFTYAWTLDGVAVDIVIQTVPADATEHGQLWGRHSSLDRQRGGRRSGPRRG